MKTKDIIIIILILCLIVNIAIEFKFYNDVKYYANKYSELNVRNAKELINKNEYLVKYEENTLKKEEYENKISKLNTEIDNLNIKVKDLENANYLLNYYIGSYGVVNHWNTY